MATSNSSIVLKGLADQKVRSGVILLFITLIAISLALYVRSLSKLPPLTLAELTAFELAALDYVVKPFDERRLAQTIERVRQALAQRDLLARKHTAMRDYLAQTVPAAANLAKLWGERENNTRLLVDYSDILWIEAEVKKVYMQTTALTPNIVTVGGLRSIYLLPVILRNN